MRLFLFEWSCGPCECRSITAGGEETQRRHNVFSTWNSVRAPHATLLTISPSRDFKSCVLFSSGSLCCSLHSLLVLEHWSVGFVWRFVTLIWRPPAPLLVGLLTVLLRIGKRRVSRHCTALTLLIRIVVHTLIVLWHPHLLPVAGPKLNRARSASSENLHSNVNYGRGLSMESQDSFALWSFCPWS